MSTHQANIARLTAWGKELADPDWCLSVPVVAKTAIKQLVAALEASQPRIINDVAELLALHMVVVRTAGGTIANIVNERAYVFGYEASVPAETLALPATVLCEPNKSPEGTK